MTISFNKIPANIRTSGTHIEFDSSRAVSGLPAIQNRVLIIGQLLAAGTAAALSLQPVVEANEAVALFGRGSMLARMVAAYKKVDRYSEVVAIGVADAVGSTAATSTLTLTGPATAAGEIALMIGGVRLPGSYQLTEDAIRILSDSDLGLPLVEKVSVVGARLVSRTAQMARQGLSLMAIELECRAPFGGFDQEFGEFRALHVDWDIPPHGNVALPLPAANPDAEDLIEVPQ